MQFKRQRALPKIMIIPMIDIIFFLLVFFMISMLGMVHQKQIPVRLPVAESAVVSTDAIVPVSITKQGAVYVEETLVALPDVQAFMQQRFARGGQRGVILRADKAVPHGVVIAVMDQLQRAGVRDVTMGTE